MTVKKTRFPKGVILKPDTDALEGIEGELKVDSSDDKIKSTLGSASRSVVTEDQTQTLENKTIDATAATGNNTLSADAADIEYDNGASGLTATDAQAAIDELKTGLDNQNEASEISYDNSTSGLTATNVQDAIDEVDGDLDAHIAASSAHGVSGDIIGTTDAQVLSNKSLIDDSTTIEDNGDSSKKAKFEASGITTATTVTMTIPDEDITIAGTAATQTITNKTIDADNNTISNLEHGAEVDDPASGVHGVTGDILGTTDTQTITNKTIDADNNTISNLEHGNEVDNPSSGVHGVTGSVVGTTDTQDLSNKTFTDAITLEELGATPTTPAAGDKKLYPKTDGKLYTLDDGGIEVEVGSGGGSGGINYIENGDAEVDTTGWATYADAAGTSPVDGTGGSPTTTFTRTTTASEVLRGDGSFEIAKDAANRQGEGASYDFTIDNADLHSAMTISFDATTSANYADGDARVYIYDVTNSNLIETVPVELLAGESGKYQAQFQTSADGTDYRLIVHISSTNATAYDIFFDNVSVGPSIPTRGFGGWKQYSLTVTGTPSWSTTSAVGVPYQTVDGKSYLQFNISGTSTGTTSLSLNVANVTFRTVQAIHASGSGTNRGQYQAVTGNGTDTLSISFTSNEDTWYISGNVELDEMPSFAEDRLNVLLSSEADTRLIRADYEGNGGESLTLNVTPIPFSTQNKDTHSAWDGDTFTAPSSGSYDLDGSVRFTTSTAAQVHLYKKAVGGSFAHVRTLDISPSSAIKEFSGGIDLNAGDQLQLRMDTSLTLSSAAVNSWLVITKAQGPSQIAANELVSARYTSNNGQAIGSGLTDLKFEDIDYDSHNAYNTSTGEYTIPASGKYLINAKFSTASSTWVAGNSVQVRIEVNGTNISKEYVKADGTTTTHMVSISEPLNLLEGDTIIITGANNQSTAMGTDSLENVFSIVRQGF